MRVYYRTSRNTGASFGPVGALVIGVFYLAFAVAAAVLTVVVEVLVAIFAAIAPDASKTTLRKTAVGVVVGGAIIASIIVGTSAGSSAANSPAARRPASSPSDAAMAMPGVKSALARSASSRYQLRHAHVTCGRPSSRRLPFSVQCTAPAGSSRIVWHIRVRRGGSSNSITGWSERTTR